jgi:uncharacterized protein
VPSAILPCNAIKELLQMRLFRLFSVCGLAVFLAVSSAAQTIQINRENKTIAISTTDEASSVADIAAISIGFEVYEADSDTAYATAGRLSKAIMEALHKADIDDKSIESKNQSLNRNTRFDDKETPAERAKKQFQFEQSWEISTTPANAAGVIRLAIAAGANQSGQIDWRLADRKALQAQAAANALVKAHAVASQMADGLHVKLGALIYASNETPNTRIYFPHPGMGQMGYGSGGGIGSEHISAPPLEIRPQTIREEATVYAVFAIE